MRRIWLWTLAPDSATLVPVETTTSVLAKIRTSDAYQAGFAILRRRVFPTVTGVAALLWLTGAITRVPFEVANLSGLVCGAGTPLHDWSRGDSVQRQMDTRVACNATGVTLVQGAQYVITVTPTTRWTDGDEIDAMFPEGFTSWSTDLSLRQRAIFTLAAPFRRSWGDRWFALTARVGRRGADYYPLTQKTPITAQTSGELFLFVNDAILPIGPGGFGWGTAYYENNHGQARVEITKVADTRSP
jgi:hypothetical protein